MAIRYTWHKPFTSVPPTAHADACLAGADCCIAPVRIAALQ